MEGSATFTMEVSSMTMNCAETSSPSAMVRRGSRPELSAAWVTAWMSGLAVRVSVVVMIAYLVPVRVSVGSGSGVGLVEVCFHRLVGGHLVAPARSPGL